MEILQVNGLAFLLITMVSLGASWYMGCRKHRLWWFALGVITTLGLAVYCVELQWANVSTATLAYCVTIIYCPLMWLIVINNDEPRTRHPKVLS